MKTANLIINNWLLLSDATCRTARPSSPFDKIWPQGDKNLNSNFLVNWGKFRSAIYAFWKSQFAPISFMNWRPIFEFWKVMRYAKFSFTVENKMENSHKKRWSHFKLNIDDWDIPFPKVLRIYKWVGKNIFHWGKWNELIANSARATKYLAKRPWRYFFLTYVFKSTALVNEL